MAAGAASRASRFTTASPSCAVAEIFFAVILGLAFGSFATALVWRVPRGISWFSADRSVARSRCPSCQKQLRFLDLIPLFSWLMQKGRCRYCKASIPARYPLIELAVFLACMAVYSQWGLTGQGFLIMMCVPFLAALFVIDMEHMILPDQLTLACLALGIGFIGLQAFESGWQEIFLTHVAGGAVLYSLFAWGLGALMKLILKKDALGFGDVKFFSMAGLWLGVGQLSAFLILSGVMGVVWGGIWGLMKKERVFPFGPALILTFYFCLLAQKAVFRL
jgi:prepilin signal peptidase PulO-like enzyme (type II secretory pathway)